MLSDEQIDIFGEGFTDILQKLEDDIIADIARRVRKTNRFTETAELQARYLRDMGWSPYKIRIEVFRLLNADKAYIDFVEQNTLEAKALQKQAIAEARKALRKTAPELYAAAGDMSFNADLSMWREAGKKLKRGGAVDRLIKSMQKRGANEVVNLTKTLGFKMPVGYTRLHRAYTSVLNDALTRTLSGGVSYTAAVEAAVRNLTRSGLRIVDYASGVSREIASAARNAVVTSLGQLTGDIMQTNIEESDVPMVQVSEHWGARESHALWQGKIFTVEQFKAVCGYGEPSNPDHIYSYNCRHTHYPYWPGISEPIAYQREPGPFTVNGRRYTYYEATQKQRSMERQIRALKREVNAGGDKATLGSEIRQRTQEYKAFSDACGIREKLERLHVLGYDRSTVARVRDTVTRLESSLPDGPRILAGYKQAVRSGDIHALTGAETYFSVAKDIQDRLVGVTAANGVKVQGFSTHFIDRVIGQTAEPHPGKRQGVPVDAALDTLLNGTPGTVRVNLDGKRGQKIKGDRCEVTINPDTGYLVQANPKVVQPNDKN